VPAWQIGIPNEAGRSSPREIRECQRPATGVGFVERCKEDGVDRARERVPARGSRIAGVFVKNNSCQKSAGLLRRLKRESIPIKFAECSSALAPLPWIVGRRICHLRSRGKQRADECSRAE